MFVPFRNFGKYGVVTDTLNQSLPIGTWTDALNVRFTGTQMEKMLEPEVDVSLTGINGAIRWLQGWSDGLSSYVVVATVTDLWFWRAKSFTEGTWINVSSRLYDSDGQWHSFSWGNTCIFNNGIDPPQIFNPSVLLFEDLPNWGLISTADEISNNLPPTRDTKASCTMLVPYKQFLVAIGVSEYGTYQPNTTWWSDSTTLAAYSTNVTGGGPPNWDYESPASLSGKQEVGIGDGALVSAVSLNENLVIYTNTSATAMTFTGGTFVMAFRRLFNKGAAGMHSVAEFNNYHFVISKDQIYGHDGSSVKLLAKDRIEEEFFKRAGKGGRFGDGSIDYNSIQVVKNPDRKELYALYNTGLTPPPSEEIGDFPTEVTATLIYQEMAGGPGNKPGAESVMGVGNGEILTNPHGDKLIYSQDGGNTFINTGVRPGGTNYRANLFIKGQGLGVWYYGGEDPNDREWRIWRTLNAGASWVMMGRLPLSKFASTALILDTEGRLVTAYRAGRGGVTLVRFDNPETSTAISSTFELPGTNVDNLKESGDGYAVSVWNGTVQNIYWVDKALSSRTTYSNSGISISDYVTWSTQFNGSVMIDDENSNGYDHFFPGSTTPLEVINPGFGITSTVQRINPSPNYWTAVARDDNNPSVLPVKLSETSSSAGFTTDITVTLPTPIDANGLMNVYWLEGDTWVMYYLSGGFVNIVRWSYSAGDSIPKGCLVYNYEDDNYTWMTPAFDNGTDLEPVVCMKYQYDPGWQWRWDDFTTETWADVNGTWADYISHGSEENMVWLTNANLCKADQTISVSGRKDYFVERSSIDLDDLVPQWTSNKQKHIEQWYFHVKSDLDSRDVNPMVFTVGWADNLMDATDWDYPETINLQSTDNYGKVKWDMRTTGRYLSIKMDFSGTDAFVMTGSDVDVSESYGR